jgi:hypothetical protein
LEADIFLDQFIIGYYGMAALEAMAYGKPVLCYVKPSVLKEEPPNLPIVNANPDNLVEMLEPLLQDGRLRLVLGKQGRAHVEKYHDAVKLAYQLVEIYQEVIQEGNHVRLRPSERLARESIVYGLSSVISRFLAIFLVPIYIGFHPRRFWGDQPHCEHDASGTMFIVWVR